MTHLSKYNVSKIIEGFDSATRDNHRYPVKLIWLADKKAYAVFGDGNHRVFAAKLLGRKTIYANVCKPVAKQTSRPRIKIFGITLGIFGGILLAAAVVDLIIRGFSPESSTVLAMAPLGLGLMGNGEDPRITLKGKIIPENYRIVITDSPEKIKEFVTVFAKITGILDNQTTIDLYSLSTLTQEYMRYMQLNFGMFRIDNFSKNKEGKISISVHFNDAGDSEEWRKKDFEEVKEIFARVAVLEGGNIPSSQAPEAANDMLRDSLTLSQRPLTGPVDKFIKWLDDILNQTDKVLTEEELNDIAKALGINPNIAKRVNREAAVMAKNAHNFVMAKLTDGSKINVFFLRDSFALYSAAKMSGQESKLFYLSKATFKKYTGALVSDLIIPTMIAEVKKEMGVTTLIGRDESETKQLLAVFKQRFAAFLENVLSGNDAGELSGFSANLKQAAAKLFNYLETIGITDAIVVQKGVRFVDTTKTGTFVLFMEALVRIKLKAMGLTEEEISNKVDSQMFYSDLSPAMSFSESLAEARTIESTYYAVDFDRKAGLNDKAVPMVVETEEADKNRFLYQVIVLRNQLQVITRAEELLRVIKDSKDEGTIIGFIAKLREIVSGNLDLTDKYINLATRHLSQVRIDKRRAARGSAQASRFSAVLGKIIAGLNSQDAEVSSRALVELFDLSKTVIQNTIFTIGLIDNVFDVSEVKRAVANGIIISLTDIVDGQGQILISANPELLKALIKAGVVDNSFETVQGLVLAPMRDVSREYPSSGNALHGRSIYSEPTITEDSFVLKGIGATELSFIGIPFDVNPEYGYLFGGVRAPLVDATVKIWERLTNALGEARSSNPNLPEKLIPNSAFSVKPAYLIVKISTADLSYLSDIRYVQVTEG